MVSSPGLLSAWQLVGNLQLIWCNISSGKGVLLFQDLHPLFVCRGERKQSMRRGCALQELWELPGAWWADRFPVPRMHPCRSGISCLVPLLTSLCLNSVQNRAVMSPVHTEHCYSKIAVSCSGSRGVPRVVALGQGFPSHEQKGNTQENSICLRGSQRI